VIKAWRNAKALAKAAKDALTDDVGPNLQLLSEFRASFCPQTKKGTADYWNCLRRYIATKNLAYTQYFGADPENINAGMLTRFARLKALG